MKATDTVRLAAKRAGLGTTELCSRIGRSGSYLAATASRGSTPKANNLAEMLEACGYALCAVPKEDVPESAIVIGPY